MPSSGSFEIAILPSSRALFQTLFSASRMMTPTPSNEPANFSPFSGTQNENDVVYHVGGERIRDPHHDAPRRGRRIARAWIDDVVIPALLPDVGERASARR